MTDQTQTPMSTGERNALLGGILGDALVDRLLEPVATARDPQNGAVYYSPSPMAQVVQAVWQHKQQQILAAVLEKLDVDLVVEQVAVKVAGQVVSKLSESSSYGYQQNVHARALNDRVLEIVAQELGQRVVDQMDLQIGPKQVGP